MFVSVEAAESDLDPSQCSRPEFVTTAGSSYHRLAVAKQVTNVPEALACESDAPLKDSVNNLPTFARDQRKDSYLTQVVAFFEKQVLPSDKKLAHRIALQAPLLTLKEEVLYFIDRHGPQIAVPQYLRHELLEQSHQGWMSGHFSGKRVYDSLAQTWCWDGMYSDAINFPRS